MSKSLFVTVLIVAGVLSTVNHSHAQETPFFAVEQETISIDASTAAKGVRLPIVGTGGYLTIPAGALSGATTILLSREAVMDVTAVPYPYRHTPVSALVSFELADPSVYTGTVPFTIEVPFISSTYYPKYAYRADLIKGLWVRTGTPVNAAEGVLRAEIKAPFAHVGVFEHTGLMSVGRASWYRYKGCDCSASPDFPKGTRLRVTNLDNGKSVIVTINDWGPERDIFPDRVVDLDAVAFKQIGKTTAGTLAVSIEPLPPVSVASH